MRLLDIRTLLSDEEKINCTFKYDSPQLGFIDPQCKLTDLPAQSKVMLPFWLAASFSSDRLAEIEMPKHFNSKMKEAIVAGSLAINFRGFSFHFFEIGMKLSILVNESHLAELRIAFCGDRYQRMMDFVLTE